MIKVINTDILTTNAEIICHQVSCRGFMGSGVAKQIKRNYPEAYKEYKRCCSLYPPEKLMGTVQIVQTRNKIIANLFGQVDCGKGKLHTSYEALKKGFLELDSYAIINNYKIALPYGIGCGFGGGDWETVHQIIIDNLKQSDVFLYKYSKR